MTTTQFATPLSTEFLRPDQILHALDLCIQRIEQDNGLNAFPTIMETLSIWKYLAICNHRTMVVDVAYRRLLRQVPTRELRIFTGHLYSILIRFRHKQSHQNDLHSIGSQSAIIDQLKDRGYYVFPSGFLDSRIHDLRKIVIESSFSAGEEGRAA